MSFWKQSWQETSKRGKRIIIISALIIFLYITFIRPLSKFMSFGEPEGFIFEDTKSMGYQKIEPIPGVEITEMLLDVPFIHQLKHSPLVNGCEVTSLAMVLNHYHIEVNKNTLADELEHVPLTYESGLKGDPNQGFVGSMTDEVMAMGVFVPPIERLAQEYVPDHLQIVASTQTDLNTLLKQVAIGNPIWVIATLDFETPTDDDFIPWKTPTGDYLVTPLIHSGVIVGFDEQNIYVNDPLYAKNRAIDRDQFEATFNKMGKQSLYLTEK
ncbi:C39 family peptidase [Enterococcus sp.]|uniref:C39 family peptidase n=1 Tax=Enterococcus sp. TaxID=35783 RepID=UPI002FC7FDF9